MKIEDSGESSSSLLNLVRKAFAYIKGGHYPISNNLVERAIRPFTTILNVKESLHLGSDTGAKMSATYHSVISAVKFP